MLDQMNNEVEDNIHALNSRIKAFKDIEVMVQEMGGESQVNEMMIKCQQEKEVLDNDETAQFEAQQEEDQYAFGDDY